jgi:hypothetical protein
LWGLFSIILEWGVEEKIEKTEKTGKTGESGKTEKGEKGEKKNPRGKKITCTTGFLKGLVTFHDQWVNAKLRRLKIDTLGTVTRLGYKRGFLKRAVLKAAYACDLEYVGEEGNIDWISKNMLCPEKIGGRQAKRPFRPQTRPKRP